MLQLFTVSIEFKTYKDDNVLSSNFHLTIRNASVHINTIELLRELFTWLNFVSICFNNLWIIHLSYANSADNGSADNWKYRQTSEF